ncbi:hypothetical protein [Neisseria sicca]|uniref:hypothetical protein n=1 Tax=Neisseria sicca TaxID=490 RepID=UPI00164A03D7
MEVWKKVVGDVEEGKGVGWLGLEGEEVGMVKGVLVVRGKGGMYVGKVGEEGFEKNGEVDGVKELGEKEKGGVVGVWGGMESEMGELEEEEKAEFVGEMGLEVGVVDGEVFNGGEGFDGVEGGDGVELEKGVGVGNEFLDVFGLDGEL